MSQEGLNRFIEALVTDEALAAQVIALAEEAGFAVEQGDLDNLHSALHGGPRPRPLPDDVPRMTTMGGEPEKNFGRIPGGPQ